MQPGLVVESRPDQQLVREVYERIRSDVDEKSYEHWIKNKVRLSVRDDTLTVGVASPFVLAWMQRQFSVVFRGAARQVLGNSARVVIEVDGRVALPRSKRNAQENRQPDRPSRRTSGPAPRRERMARRYARLADFVPGPDSQMALAAANHLCQQPHLFEGPLYLFGRAGLGKTHLLEGIAQQLRRCPGMDQVAYFTAETFANYFTEALRGRTMPAFRNRFRRLDALLVDDFDFLDGKGGIQQEFLHTAKELGQRGRVLAVAADCHPRLLTRTTDELVSRFSSGTVCRIDAPDLATRRKILQQRADRWPTPPKPVVLEYIAQRFRGNVRELDGALNCLGVYARLAKGPIGVATARRILGDLERDCHRSVRVADIERAVCDVLGVEPEEVRSAKRSRSVSQPRMLAMYLARKHTQATYGEIGKHFGGRNHSTVIAAVRKMNGLLEAPQPVGTGNSTMFQEAIASVEGQLRAG